jgi:predicted lipoprotein with Yx(FWY)xxD motif
MISSLARLRAVKHPGLLLAVPAAAAGVAVLAACGSSGGSSASSSASTSSNAHVAAAAASSLKTAKVGNVTVLTNAKGFTLYSFAPDSSTKSTCNGACAQAWPPVKPTTTSAVKAPYTTIKRSNGATQLAFHGHPLYTFAGDSAPGQAKGNNVNAFGGLWHEAPVSGGAAPASTSSSGTGGVGY